MRVDGAAVSWEVGEKKKKKGEERTGRRRRGNQ
jgi:hypothetical protein